MKVSHTTRFQLKSIALTLLVFFSTSCTQITNIGTPVFTVTKTEFLIPLNTRKKSALEITFSLPKDSNTQFLLAHNARDEAFWTTSTLRFSAENCAVGYHSILGTKKDKSGIYYDYFKNDLVLNDVNTLSIRWDVNNSTLITLNKETIRIQAIEQIRYVKIVSKGSPVSIRTIEFKD